MSSLKDLSDVLLVSKDCFISQDEDNFPAALDLLNEFVSGMKIAVFILVKNNMYDGHTEQIIQVLDWKTQKALYAQDDSGDAFYMYTYSDPEKEPSTAFRIDYKEAHPFHYDYKNRFNLSDELDKKWRKLGRNAENLYLILKEDLQKIGYILIKKNNATNDDFNFYASTME